MDPTSVAGCQRVEHEARPLQQLVNVVSHSTAALVHGPFGRITHHSGRQTRTKKSYVKHVAATRVYPNEAGHSLYTPILLPLSSYFFENEVEHVCIRFHLFKRNIEKMESEEKTLGCTFVPQGTAFTPSTFLLGTG